MAAMIVEASAAGADVVAFPELAGTGMSDQEVRRAGASELDDALVRIREVARSKRICTVFGMPHTKTEREPTPRLWWVQTALS